jgi:hypothetical protein
MFGFLYEMMAGQHGELPGRRGRAAAIAFDASAGTFAVDDAGRADEGDPWLGRNEVPGAARHEPTITDTGSVVDEMRELAGRPQTPR